MFPAIEPDIKVAGKVLTPRGSVTCRRLASVFPPSVCVCGRYLETKVKRRLDPFSGTACCKDNMINKELPGEAIYEYRKVGLKNT